MSRKTRKLIWSAPLVAVLTVAGALAMFVMLAPNGALAHEAGDNTVPHLPPNPVTGIEVTTPTAEEGGRTSLRVTWNAPAAGDDPTMYRVDISTDARIWHNVIGGEMSTDTLMKSDAESACTTGDAGDSCHTFDNLLSDRTYHFRVFAMNQFGTSPISVDETIGSGKTLAVDPPDRVSGLMATDYHDEKIVLYWDEPVDTGGAPVVWYCLAVAASPSGPFADLADTGSTDVLAAHNATPAEVCRDADDATDYDDVMEAVNALAAGTPTNPVVIVVDPEDGPTYEHEDLSTPDVIALRYRVYAVTDDNGDMADGRRVARAASNTATGRTIDLPDDETERPASPGAPENLRGVAFASTYQNQGTPDDPTDDTVTSDVLYFYWNHPAGYLTGEDVDEEPDLTNDLPAAWEVQVQAAIANADGTDSEWRDLVEVTDAVDVPGTVYGTPQYAVDLDADIDLVTTDIQNLDLLTGTPRDQQFRVRYIDLGADETRDEAEDDPDPDDVPGGWAEVKLRLPIDRHDYIETTDVGAASTLPRITKADDNGTHNERDPETAEGLRFVRNPDDPKRRIDLLWMRDMNSNSEDALQLPTGYVIDRSDDGGNTWKALDRATDPRDLGTDTEYTDRIDVAPGQQYTYRVFPVSITEGRSQDDFGLPATIEASAEEAEVPDPVTGLDVAANGQTGYTLTWNEVTVNGGHMIEGYVVQIASDDDDDMNLDVAATWHSFKTTIALTEADNDPTTVDADEFEYNVTAERLGETLTPALPSDFVEVEAGSVRWFRVIAITDENDGRIDTGGNDVDIVTGVPDTGSPSTGETSPTDADTEQSEPEKGKTEDLPAPPPDAQADAPAAPVDLTAEAAFDTNALSDDARGVFLTWNEVEGAPTETISYRIERIRMNTGVDALNNDADDWQYIGRARGDTSFTDGEQLRQEGEIRMYRVGSEATGQITAIFTDPAVDYALHPDEHVSTDMTTITSAMADSDTEVTVSWTAPADAGGNTIAKYKVMWKMSSAADYADADMAMTADAMAMSHQVTGLTRGMDYIFKVVALDANDMAIGAYSMEAPATTHDVPGMPMNVMAAATSDTMITVTWEAPASNGGSDITGYMVQSKYGDGEWMDVDPAHTGMEMMYMDTGLMPGTTYYYRVRAMNAVDYGEWSDGMATTHDVPGMPMNVMAAATSDTMITVTWEAPASNGGSDITGYMVQSKYGDGAWMDVDPAHTGMEMMYMDTGLMPGTTYYYRVRAMNAVDNGEWSDGMAMAMTEAAAPGMPMNVMAAATSDTMITVTWEAPASNGGSDITGYMVQSKYGDGEWMDVDPAHTGMDKMYMDTGLMPATTYYYRVLAMNAVGNGEWSDGMAMAMTEEAPDTTLGDAIGLMMVETDIDPGTIELTWTAGANANVHRVAGARKTDDGSFDLTDQVWELVEGDTQNSFTVDGNALNLSPGTYLFAVIAGQRDDSGQTTWGSTWAVLDNVAYQQ